MKKMFKTMVSAVAAVTMLTEAAMPVFAEESTYDHEKAMEEFRVYMSDAITEIENICDMLNQLTENMDNFYKDEFFSCYKLTDETIAENNLSEWYKCIDFYQTTDNNKLYYGYNCSGDLESINNRLQYFNPHNIDGTDYITLDGHDYVYHIVESDKFCVLYVNVFNDSIFTNLTFEWHKPLKTPYITDADWAIAENDSEYKACLEKIIQEAEEYNKNRIPEFVYEEEYENIFYLADKVYEANLTDLCSFFNRSYNKFYNDNKGFENVDDYRRYCAESLVIDLLAKMSRDNELPETTKERIEPLLDENGAFYRDIDADGIWSPKDIEIFKKYYNNEFIPYDVDFDDELTVKDLASIKMYLINEADFSPMQKMISQNEDKTIDIRTVTKASRKIVKLD